MWILFAFGSAFFAGLHSIAAKCGIRHTDSDVATAIRTGVVLIMAALMVTIVGAWAQITSIPIVDWAFLVLSGLSTGASWLLFDKALKKGDVNKVVPIDKSSTVLASIFAFLLLGERVTWIKVCCLAVISVGIFLMEGKPHLRHKLETKDDGEEKSGWFVYAALSAVFAALTTILGKAGMKNVDPDLATFIRTVVVLIFAWVFVFATGRGGEVKTAPKKELWFVLLSGVLTGASWICYFYALKFGDVNVVVPIDKLSIVVTVVFSHFAFKEKLSPRSIIGLTCIVVGTLCMLIPY